MTTWQVAQNTKKLHLSAWGTRVGVAGFMFFLAKGVLWLILPLVIYGIR